MTADDAAIRSATAHLESVKRNLAVEVGAAARTAASAIIAHDATSVEVALAKSELNLAMTDYRAKHQGTIVASIARDLYTQAVSDEIAALYAQAQAQATLDAELTP